MIITRLKNYKGEYLKIKNIPSRIAVNFFLNHKKEADITIVLIKHKI